MAKNPRQSRKRTRRGRRAPRPRARTTSRLRTRSPICSIPASAAAPPAWVPAPAKLGVTAAAGQFVGPPPRFFRGAQGAQVAHPKEFNEAPQRDYTASPVTGLDPTAGEGTGPGRRRDARAALVRQRRRDQADTGGDPKYRLPRADLPTQPGGLSSTGVAATASRSNDCCARAGRNSRAASRWTPHRPPRPEKSEGGKRFVIESDFEPKGDQPQAIKELVEGVKRQRPHAGAARRHRLGQDLHHGQGDRGDAAPGAHPRAEQDAGRAALRRVQVVLPRQRGRVFRLLLRLLPAGSLRPAHRHLYREGILDQRADRPHAPFGDARAARTRRRHHRRLGVVHLRHRLGRNLFGDDLHAQAGRQDRPAPADRRSGRAAIQAHAGRFLPRLVPRARRHDRDLPGAL